MVLASPCCWCSKGSSVQTWLFSQRGMCSPTRAHISSGGTGNCEGHTDEREGGDAVCSSAPDTPPPLPLPPPPHPPFPFQQQHLPPPPTHKCTPPPPFLKTPLNSPPYSTSLSYPLYSHLQLLFFSASTPPPNMHPHTACTHTHTYTHINLQTGSTSDLFHAEYPEVE